MATRAFRHLVRMSCASLAALLVAAPAAAQDDLAALRGLLEEPVVISASKVSETAETAPATSSVLTADDMRRSGIRSLDEAINYLSLGLVASESFRTADVGSRGVLLAHDNGAHILLLVDGHHMNEPLFGSARFDRGLGIPFELVDHIEIILGPGSVLYGSNAMLGVINVITKRAKDFVGAHAVAETEIGKSYRAGAGAGTVFDLLGKPVEATLGLDYYRKYGPVFTLGPQDVGRDPASGKPTRFAPDGTPTGVWGGRTEHSNYAVVPSAYARLRLDELSLSINASMFKRGVPSTQFDFDDPTTNDRDRRLWADLSYSTPLSHRVRVSARLYGDSFDFVASAVTSSANRCLFQGADVCRYDVLTASRWGGLEVQSSFDWFEDARLVTLVGADGRLTYAAYKRDTFNERTNEPVLPTHDLTRSYDRLLGIYAQNVWRPVSSFDLNVGARVDARPTFETAINPRAATNIRPWQGGTIKIIYAEAFRSPTLSELGAASGIQARARDLQPEKVASTEASVEQRFGAQRALFGVFRSRWTNLIENRRLSREEITRAVALGDADSSQDAGLLTQFQNLSSILNYGFNAAYEGSALDGQLRFGATFTGALARHQGTAGEPDVLLPAAPQAYGNAHISYDLRGDWPTLALAGRYAGSRPADLAYSGSFHPTPYASAAASARVTATGAVPYVPGLSYRVSLDVARRVKAPYVIGPTLAATHQNPTAELTPVDPLRAAVGLQYDF